MKHIKNSLTGSIFLLEHHGIPTSNTTDFNEVIISGSLCVDITNNELYILKNTVWTKIGSGFDINKFIPLQGTYLNKPTFGDVEFVDNKGIYSGQSRIKLTNNSLYLQFSDNDLNTLINNTLKLDKNTIWFKDNSLLNVDSSSIDNFIFSSKTTTGTGLSLQNSLKNILLTNIGNQLSLINSSSNNLMGEISSTLSLINVNKSKLYLNINNPLTIANVSQTEFNISSSISTLTLNQINNSNFKGYWSGTSSLLNIISYVYYEGNLVDSNLNNLVYSSIYGITNKLFINEVENFYNLGIVNSEPNGLNTFSLSLTTNITFSKYLFNLGNLGLSTIFHSNNLTLLGMNASNIINYSNFNILNNNYGHKLNNSDYNTMINNDDVLLTSNIIYSSNNLLFNNKHIYSTSGSYNVVINTTKISIINGIHNFIINSDDVALSGNYNFLNGLKSGYSYKADSYNTIFGNVSGTSSLVDIKTGNTIIGNVILDNSLTNNNIIFGAKLLSNIKHSNNNNNIILNVDNFSINDSNSVFLPNRFYGVNLGFTGLFNLTNISDNRQWIMPNNSGTIALTSDIVDSEKVKVSGTDGMSGYLFDKLVGSTNILLTKNGINQQIEISYIQPTGLKTYYVDGNNTMLGDGSILNPFKTIDMVVDFIRNTPISNRVAIKVSAYSGINYIVNRNLWLNVDWIFEAGAIITNGVFGNTHLFDQISAINYDSVDLIQTAPNIYGEGSFILTGKGFFISKDTSLITQTSKSYTISFSLIDCDTSNLYNIIEINPAKYNNGFGYVIIGNNNGNNGIILNRSSNNSNNKVCILSNNGLGVSVSSNFNVYNISFTEMTTGSTNISSHIRIISPTYNRVIKDCEFYVNPSGISNCVAIEGTNGLSVFISNCIANFGLYSNKSFILYNSSAPITYGLYMNNIQFVAGTNSSFIRKFTLSSSTPNIYATYNTIDAPAMIMNTSNTIIDPNTYLANKACVNTVNNQITMYQLPTVAPSDYGAIYNSSGFLKIV